MARGHVLARSRNANGNVMDRSHTNPILDTRTYQVEFAGSEVTELITNIIAESLNAECDLEGNEYLLLDALVDYGRDNKAISLSDQQTMVQGRPVTHMTTAGWQNSLPVERRFYLMGETVRVKRVPSCVDS